MPDTRVRRTITQLGESYTTDDTISAGQSTLCDDVELVAAKTGTLTTRTNTTQGVITLAASHGFSSGTHDIYWSGGARYGVTTSISVNACTISSGTGDDLPVADTAMTVALPVSETFAIPASGAKSLLVKAPSGKLRVSFRTSVPGIVYTVVHEGTNSVTYFWDATTGGANPLGSDAIATIFMSNGNTTVQTPVISATWND